MNVNRRKHLVDSFHETVQQLENAYLLQHEGRDVGLLLVQSISMHADEDMLQEIQADLNAELVKAQQSRTNGQGLHGDNSIVIETRARIPENSHTG